MSSTPAPLVRANIQLQGEGFSLQLQAVVPAGPARQADLLPLARAIADAVVEQTGQLAASHGNHISCRMGCTACCRSLVALSEAEAQHLAGRVAALPEPRRSAVLARFDTALATLAEAGLLARLQQWQAWSEAEYRAQVTAYFAATVPCPLLEDEACTVYAERPLTCREFVVTSPARHCSELGSAQVRRLPLPLQMFNAVARWQPAEEGDVQERWVPLVLALAWAEAHPDDTPAATGPELLRQLLGALNA